MDTAARKPSGIRALQISRASSCSANQRIANMVATPVITPAIALHGVILAIAVSVTVPITVDHGQGGFVPNRGYSDPHFRCP